MSDTVHFNAVGQIAIALIGNTDKTERFKLMAIKFAEKKPTDIVVGFQSDKTFIIRSSSTEELNTNLDHLQIQFTSARQTSYLELLQQYTVKLEDISDCAYRDVQHLDPMSLGTIHIDDGDRRVILMMLCSTPDDTGSTHQASSPASLPASSFKPLLLGGHGEVKDQKGAYHMWLSSLNLTTVKKTSDTRIGYSRKLADETWKKCGKWEEVLEAATNESNIDIYDDFLNNPAKFQTIIDMGKKAFVRRRRKREDCDA